MQAMQQKEEMASVAASLQQKGQLLEREANREIADLKARVLQLLEEVALRNHREVVLLRGLGTFLRNVCNGTVFCIAQLLDG